jgi:hypothetical protein
MGIEVELDSSSFRKKIQNYRCALTLTLSLRRKRDIFFKAISP